MAAVPVIPASLIVHTEEVLEGDRGVGQRFAADFDMLFGLDGLVQALGVAASEHQPACEIVHDDDFAVADDVFFVALEEFFGAQGVVEVGEHMRVFRIVDVLVFRDIDHMLDFGGAFLGEDHGLAAHVDLVVLFGAQAGRDVGETVVQLGWFLRRAGDDERRARLVDEDAVDLVDDGEVQGALRALVEVDDHIVAQIVEAELVVGAVGDVGVVGFAARDGAQVLVAVVVGGVVGIVEEGGFVGFTRAGLDDAGADAEGVVDWPHPLDAEFRQIVVGRDEVHAFACERVEIERQRGDQGLALAGAHFGDVAFVQDHPADKLHVVVAHSGGAAAGFANGSEGFGQEIVQRLARFQALAESIRFRAQGFVGEGCELRFQRVDVLYDLLQPGDSALVGITENPLEEAFRHPVLLFDWWWSLYHL